MSESRECGPIWCRAPFSGVGAAGCAADTSPKVWRFVADFVQEWGFSGRHYVETHDGGTRLMQLHPRGEVHQVMRDADCPLSSHDGPDARWRRSIKHRSKPPARSDGGRHTSMHRKALRFEMGRQHTSRTTVLRPRQPLQNPSCGDGIATALDPVLRAAHDCKAASRPVWASIPVGAGTCRCRGQESCIRESGQRDGSQSAIRQAY